MNPQRQIIIFLCEKVVPRKCNILIMKTIFSLLILGGLFFSGCQEDPNIQLDGFRTKPVIYSVIESLDSVHFIKLGRFFSGYSNPAQTARIADSIYFNSANIKVTLVNLAGKMVDVPVERVTRTGKEQGFFNSDDYALYRFEKKLVHGQSPYISLAYEYVYIEVDIPELPKAVCSTSLVFPPKFWSPVDAQQFIYIFPDNPVRVLWSGGEWNEIDVTFKIMEEYRDSTVTQVFALQKSNDILINGKYYEIKIPYELIVEILQKNLKVRTDLVRRYFGPFRIEVLTGNADYYNYQKYIGGINDYNFNPFGNVQNGIGILSARSKMVKKALYLDQVSRLKFASDSTLRKFNFIEY